MNPGSSTSTGQTSAPRAALVWLAALSALAAAAAAQAQGAPQGTVYRCPGPPVLYTDTLSAQEARDRGCRTIEGAPITVVQTRPRPATASAPAGGAAAAPAAARPPEARVDPAEQRARDSDARRILNEELQREERRLAELQREYNGGEPERRGDERNYQRYLDRVAELKAGISRKEADIAAIRREIGKLPQ
jgi:hypothetical protein